LYGLKKEAIASMACKMSIKANKVLSNMEVQNLINDIKALDKPTCPHGRPLIVELSKTEIEKMFKRIQ
jgi:DNA mismatch repair protein MutL